MKSLKLSIIFASMVLSILVLNSCTKSDDYKMSKDGTIGQSDNPNKDQLELTHLQKFSTGYECIWPAVNCLPVVIIEPGTNKSSAITKNSFEIYEELLIAINIGNTEEFFSGTDYSQIFPFLDQPEGLEYREILRSGKVKLIQQFDSKNSITLFIAVNIESTAMEPEVEATYLTLQVKLISE